MAQAVLVPLQTTYMPNPNQIDSTVEVVTPENIAFRYNVAGPFRRLPAFVLDLMIRVALFIGLAILISLAAGLSGVPELGAGVLILWFALDWFYGAVLETWLNGQTPGKWMTGLRVLSVNGQPINGIQAVIRNFLRMADMFPLISVETFGIPAPAYSIPTFVLALIMMSANRRFQRLGDIAAGTVVVIEERRWLTGVAKLDDERAPQLANLIPADYPISRPLARTLTAYVERRRFFSAPRRREIARHVAEPLLERFGFPADTSYDLLMCALYYRAFIADRGRDELRMPMPMTGEGVVAELVEQGDDAAAQPSTEDVEAT